MRIDKATGINAALTGSFSGSFTGVGNFTGLEADSVAWANITSKPANIVSGSDQIATSFAQTILDDGDAATVRTTIGVDAAGTDNSTNVTLVGTPNYLTLSGQAITLGTVDIADDTNFAVSDTTGQTGINLTLTDDTVSGVVVGLTTTSNVQFNDVQVDSIGIGTAASSTTGEIRATGDITAYYSSDERLKENFKNLDGALDKVNKIGGYEFDWKEGIEDVVSKKGHDIGVKAQELQAQYPELVHERDNGFLAVDYVKLNAVLIEAVKELTARVVELEKRS
jgi:hypothetical protein